MKQQNCTRYVQPILRVTPQEYEHIQKKMALIGTNNFNAYARKMLIDGYVIEVDLSQYHELASEVNKIGVNINQIAKIVGGTRGISTQQIDLLQQEVEQIKNAKQRQYICYCLARAISLTSKSKRKECVNLVVH